MEKPENYPYKILNERISGKDVSILGVKHTLEFYDRYKDFFKDFTSKYDAFVFEQPYKGDFWLSPFFEEIGNLISGTGKRIYQADPINQNTNDFDIDSFYGGIFLMLEGLVGPNLRNYVRKRINPNFKEKKTSRRNFLKRAACAGAGASLAFGSFPGFLARSLYGDNLYGYGVDDILTYGETDYRNIKIAEGIEKICMNINDIKNLGVIHGATHTEPIAEYLNNEALRLKKLAYFPYEIIGRTKVREYVPNKDAGGEWKLVREF